MNIRIEHNADGKYFRTHFSLDGARWFELRKVSTFEDAEKEAFWLSHTLELNYGTQIHD